MNLKLLKESALRVGACAVVSLCLGIQTGWADTITRYVAVLESGSVINNGAPSSTAPQTGIAYFTLTQPDGDPSATTLSYDIRLNDLDLDGLQTPGVGNEGDNVTAIHLHNTLLNPDGSPSGGDTAGTLHVMNIFGTPRGGDDDDDMTFDPVAGTVAGLWEDSDATPGEAMAPTLTISSQVGLLESGAMFLMVHNNDFPGGAIGAHLVAVPEPSSILLGLGAYGCVCAFWRGRGRIH